METEMEKVTRAAPLDEHLRAREIDRHRVRVEEIKRRAQHWRLADCGR